eukprot:2548633-Rhodomonas_salina.1
MLNGAAPGPTGMIPASSVPKWPASIDPIAGADIPAPHIEPMALDPRERQKDLEQEYSVAAWPGNAYRNKPGAASDEGSGSSNARLSTELKCGDVAAAGENDGVRQTPTVGQLMDGVIAEA